jgi:hypothetical protein
MPFATRRKGASPGRGDLGHCPGRVLLLETAYFQYLHAERLEPGEKSVQHRPILQRAVQDGLDWLHGCVELLEVEQSLGREDPGYTDLIVRGHHNKGLLGVSEGP